MRSMIFSVAIVGALFITSRNSQTAFSEPPPPIEKAPVVAVLCGSVSKTDSIKCKDMFADRSSMLCISSGTCNADGICEKKPSATMLGHFTKPADWRKEYFQPEESNGPDAKKIKTTTHKCFEILNCKRECEMRNGRRLCATGTTLLGHGDITLFEEDGACPPPKPPVVVPPVDTVEIPVTEIPGA